MLVKYFLCSLYISQQLHCSITALTSSLDFSELHWTESWLTTHSLTNTLTNWTLTDSLTDSLTDPLTNRITDSLTVSIHSRVLYTALNWTGPSQELQTSLTGVTHLQLSSEFTGYCGLRRQLSRFSNNPDLTWGSRWTGDVIPHHRHLPRQY
jgi:hypothetical protein